jgi:hypothetical protein
MGSYCSTWQSYREIESGKLKAFGRGIAISTILIVPFLHPKRTTDACALPVAHIFISGVLRRIASTTKTKSGRPEKFRRDIFPGVLAKKSVWGYRRRRITIAIF